MLRAVARGFARLIGAPLPEYPDGSPMPAEEYEAMMRDWNDQKRRLDDELYWTDEWDRDDHRKD